MADEKTLQNKIKRLENEMTKLMDHYDKKVAECEEAWKKAQEANRAKSDAQEELREALEQIREMGCKNAELKAGEEWERVHRESAEYEVLTLKAKLYDIMAKEGE